MNTKGVEDGIPEKFVCTDPECFGDCHPIRAVPVEERTAKGKMVTVEYPTREQCYERAIGLIHKLRPAGCFGDEEGEYSLLELYVMALHSPPIPEERTAEMEQLIGRLRELAEKSIPGPWAYQEESDAYTHIVRQGIHPNIHGWVCSACQSSSPTTESTARFIAEASPENILKLLDHIEGKGK